MPFKKTKTKFRERLKRISARGHILVAFGDFLAGLALGSVFTGTLNLYALPLLLAGIGFHLPALYEILTNA